ncbi:hypothetical protein C1645_735733 [Glomus cerebriforme]|uniref:SAM domain-containing protein n=1 Tax=Glomus cerebriforme TaxID=658196 RepID=A0A397T9U5_9GLOM|nr:hypothetical protein C1645_735733 [Glomus cerebriforme]
MVVWCLDLFSKITTDKLVDFLRKSNLLDVDVLQILEKEKINGLDFILFSKEEFHFCGLKRGPATRLAKTAWCIKNKKGEELLPNTCVILDRLSQSLGQPSVPAFPGSSLRNLTITMLS